MSMFSSALKSFSLNITSNYVVSPTAASVSGPWKIHDAKKKTTGKEVSVFIFDRKSLETQSGGLGRSSSSSLKRAVDEVVERLKKEASSLARLRHPNVLELVEPVEETRTGLQFATEAVTASLSGLLQEKDDQERAGGIGGRSSRYVTGDAEGNRRRREVEIDELEIQKGLLQISKALEFLHENAGLVHGNLTPDAIFINAKSDWKISGLSFLSPPENSSVQTSVVPISLSEILNIDPRLPKSVQLNLDYASPDFVLDLNLNVSADLFSLGLLIITLYNSPHISPLQANSSVSSYKKLFASSSTIPSSSNDYLSSRPLPKDLTSSVLPRLITRRPAQRMTAREFQQSAYFDNILVSTIRFLESLPAKTPAEKNQFMRGLSRVIPSFPKSVLEKKILPALLDEMKDRELLSLILQNIFKIIQLLPSGKRSFSDKIVPCLREHFVPPAQKTTAGVPERDPAKEAGLMVLLENIGIITENCTGKEFKDEILPIINTCVESPTHSIIDAALRILHVVLPVLDFSTIKNELFPVIASVFSKTSSLGIKVRGLEAFVILCGGSDELESSSDGLDGIAGSGMKKKSVSSALDKYTMQEKVLPLIKAIRTKEPAVMLAALKVLKQIGSVADTEFIATDILPILWSMSLGPLLDLKQFQLFMEVIKSLSGRVEQEHKKKLQELSSSTKSTAKNDDFMSFGGVAGFPSTNGGGADNSEDNFKQLVQGKVTSNGGSSNNLVDNSWDAASNRSSSAIPTATFSWSSPSPAALGSSQASASLRSQQTPSRTITPDLSRFDTLTPSAAQFSQPQPTTGSQPLQPTASAQFSQPLQPTTTSTHYSQPLQPMINYNMRVPSQPQIRSSSQSTAVDWSVPANNAWQSTGTGLSNNLASSMSSLSMNHQRPAISNLSSFSLPPPPPMNSFQIPPPPAPFQRSTTANTPSSFHQQLNNVQSSYSASSKTQQNKPPAQKSGLDAYESLL